ncbi:2-hydroxyacid dehydrogenase [Pyxidicoccus fallax]|uniref:2-hydroxyacid dehydrogenase n=1 Tax=Pyxidicoccus fallax TaxID=394095 RepID=A0A848LK45_9BACT|nr:2-hydroxyacid dehydrogenase [Pyxidicoccus fallax]NMO18080.1 2-hydroxyacid dehydrogenase [Pyxidicoccus fallax]NPC78586.1 2-hydroxyacid dehydrogenase [Pyxidicoccus fallax]
MRLAVFDTHRYDRDALEKANAGFGHALTFFEPRLTLQTARLADGFPAVCSFVNDRVDAATLEVLHAGGVRLVAARSAGYNHVDLETARRLGIRVTRVPEYSPHAVAEHAVALVLSLVRHIPRAFSRVRDWNFSLDGLVGFDLAGKTVGVVGTGRIGRVAARIFRGFGCRVLCYDVAPDAGFERETGVRFVPLEELFSASDIISLHVPLTPSTRHMVDGAALARMKKGVVLVNTGRGALINSRALLAALKTGHIGGAGLDVYEEEEGIFFQDLSGQVLQDDTLARLLTFPNVLVTSHQAFLTHEALANIAETTLASVTAFERGEPLVNEVRAEQVIRAPPASR